MADRNRRVVELCNQLDPDFVVHLGDIVHPLPVEEAHEPVVQLAAGIYSELAAPIHFVPGNHDIGDKPNALVAVPAVADQNYEVFEEYWGPAFSSFDHGNCHFVLVDTPVLNSGMERERAQRVWLDQDLTVAHAAGKRIFLFTHYPPFVRDVAEDEHYDNIGQPARSWLLELLERYDVEAVFSGHVHNFLYNHHEGTELYVVPSTGFVRPDYSELAAILPESEGGRDDPAKLGFFVVDITDDGHTIRPIRTFGSIDLASPTPPIASAVSSDGWRSPIGVTLRHGWMSEVDFPTAGLDEFRRKTIRNDAQLPALWEARISEVRIPVGDLSSTTAAARIGHLSRRGMDFTVRSGGIPDPRTIDTIAALAKVLTRWEIVAFPDDLNAVVTVLDSVSTALTVALAPVTPLDASGAAVHHFVASGFDPFEDSTLDNFLESGGHDRIDELVFRVTPNGILVDACQAAEQRASAVGKRAVVNVELPRGAESVVFADDAAIADRVAEAARVARRFPDVAAFLDGFVDHDRGYYPRHGIIDRHFNPRPALHQIIRASSGART
ncbi:MAG: hypothetical protein GY720_10095 [bacterium]|nr:hypothetical protein [bacterium]